MSMRKSFYFLLLVFLPFLLGACCSEIETSYMWQIVNKSSDSLIITFSNRPDSMVILPKNQFGKFLDQEFACGSTFVENTYTIKIAGNRTLHKSVHDPGNWESQLSKRAIYCDQMRKCIFTIEEKDVY